MNQPPAGRHQQPNSTLGRDAARGSAYECLRAAIASGSLKPGSRVTETELATRLGISRTPVREAVLRLEQEGLLTHAPRQGMKVAELDYQAVIELYAMREVLEGFAARLAAAQASPAELELLREVIEAERRSGGQRPALAAAANRQFHQILYHAAHNRFLLKSLNALADSMLLLGDTTLALPGRHATALDEHEAIVDAITRRAPDEAEEVARRHIRAALRHRVQMILGKAADATAGVGTGF